jgi:outer membrane autotransporter protein
VLAAWQRVHGGINWADVGHDDFDHAFHIHDQGVAVHEWRLGVGVSYPVSEAAAVYMSYSGLLWGENTHNASGVIVGLNWTFQAFGGGFTLGGPGND